MRNPEAMRISQYEITFGQLQEMMLAAYDAGAANRDRSRFNPSFTKGKVFNMLWPMIAGEEPGRAVSTYRERLGVRHMLWEFGKFWQGWRPPKQRMVCVPLPEPCHEEPIDPRRKDDG